MSCPEADSDGVRERPLRDHTTGTARTLAEPVLPEMGQDNRRSSDGNFANVGNADSDGANVNRNPRDNRNGNLGVCVSK
ncbi:MAG: hypothetical protein WC641_03515 [Patescibacteria group bacterium]